MVAAPWRQLRPRCQRSVAMLRCHVVAVHIPGATGFGPGVLLSVCFRGTLELGTPRGLSLCHRVHMAGARLPLAPQRPQPEVPPPLLSPHRRPQENPGGARGAQPHLE